MAEPTTENKPATFIVWERDAWVTLNTILHPAAGVDPTISSRCGEHYIGKERGQIVMSPATAALLSRQYEELRRVVKECWRSLHAVYLSIEQHGARPAAHISASIIRADEILALSSAPSPSETEKSEC